MKLTPKALLLMVRLGSYSSGQTLFCFWWIQSKYIL